jgi:tRNA A-37 threonylcarbamoyl transferase component Bud32
MPLSYEKLCRSNRAFENELFIYRTSFPCKAELIEVRKPRTLVLKRIDGIPYLDAPYFTGEMVTKLAKAIARFHSLVRLEDKVLCHWDNQPRNILWNEKQKRFYLLDFEDIRLARPEADIAHLFLFWMEVLKSDIFTQLTSTFIKAYKGIVPISAGNYKTELRKAKNRFYARRKRYNKKKKIINPSAQLNRKTLSSKELSLLFPQP